MNVPGHVGGSQQHCRHAHGTEHRKRSRSVLVIRLAPGSSWQAPHTPPTRQLSSDTDSGRRARPGAPELAVLQPVCLRTLGFSRTYLLAGAVTV